MTKGDDLVRKEYILRAVIISALCTGGVCHGALAEETADKTMKSRDIIVTASKTAEEIRTEPQAVEVITADDMRRMGADDLLTALALANNLNLSKATMTGNAVQIRGMSTNHVLILVDGKRYAAEDTNVTTNVYNLQRLNVDDIERVEIVRGPSSSLYGSDAMGGVINVITKVPEKAGGNVGMVTGSSLTAGAFNFNFGKHGRWTTSFDGRIEQERRHNRYTHSESLNPMTHQVSSVTDGNTGSYGTRRMFHLVSQYDFENANKNKLRFDVDLMNEDARSDFADTKSHIYVGDGYLMQMGPFPKAPKDWVLTNKNKREWYHNDQYGFSVEYTGKTKRNAYTFRSYYNELKKDSHLYNDRVLPKEKVRVNVPPMLIPKIGFPFIDYDYGAQYAKEDTDYAKYSTWVTEAQDTLYIGENHNLTFGGEYRTLEYKGTRLSDSPTGVNKRAETHGVNSYTAFIQDQWQINDKLYLVPSLRYEHNSRFGSETTPRLGLTYAINPYWRFKANYGRGYKAPSISEMYMRMHRSMGPMSVNIYGNPDLKPEKSRSYDFGVEMEKGAWFGKVTYFNNDVSNLITTDKIAGTDSDYHYINVNEAGINGVEAEVGKRLNNRWTVKLTHNYLDAVNQRSHQRLNNRAKNTTTLQLIYDDHNADKGFSAILWDQFSDKYRLNDQDYTYNTLNFSFDKHVTKDISVYGGVENILNKKVDDLYVDGRFWRIGAEWRW